MVSIFKLDFAHIEELESIGKYKTELFLVAFNSHLLRTNFLRVMSIRRQITACFLIIPCRACVAAFLKMSDYLKYSISDSRTSSSSYGFMFSFRVDPISKPLMFHCSYNTCPCQCLYQPLMLSKMWYQQQV